LTLAHELLAARLPSGWYIRNQMPLAIAGRRPNDPLPDVAVIEGRPRDFPVEPPAWARLVVEISDSSLDFDLTDKARLYATAGIPAYWVVDLSNRAVQVFRLPTADGYSQQTVMTALQALTLPWPADPVQVGDLLP
jgi:Uma2 family endonuclease